MSIYNKGVALFISVALLFLLSAGAAITLLTSYNYANISENQIKRSRAISVAESGISYAYWKIRIGEDDGGNPMTYPSTLTPPITMPEGWTIQIDIAEDVVTGRKKIESKVTY